MPEQVTQPQRRKVALALRGGGSHGAFTWGVFDRLLDDQMIELQCSSSLPAAMSVVGTYRRLCRWPSCPRAGDERTSCGHANSVEDDP